MPAMADDFIAYEVDYNEELVRPSLTLLGPIPAYLCFGVSCPGGWGRGQVRSEI